MMLSTLLTLPQAVLAGSMTYGIVDYPADQNGWALSGAITTDGKTGVLAPSDILSWTWTISTNFHGELIVFTASSSDFNSAISSTGLEATTKHIEVPPGGALGMFDPIMEGLLIEYNNAPPMGPSTYYSYVYGGAGPGRAYPWFTLNPTMGGTDPWIIASVPEPSTLYLLGFGAVCGSVYVMGHKVDVHTPKADVY